MEKEILNSREPVTKAARLREAVKNLQQSPLGQTLSDAEWEGIVSELTQDELDQLEKLARGHLARARDAVAEGLNAEAAEEASAAVLLGPRTKTWAQEVVQTLKGGGWTGPEASTFFRLLAQRTGQRRRKHRRWLGPLIGSVLAIPLVVWALMTFGSQINLGGIAPRLIGPRTLEVSFDTQGVKTNISIAQRRLIIFPDATVAELSAWVTFPDHRVELWEGKVNVLDGAGNTLTSREVTFRSASEGPIEAGQGVEVFEQFDAWPWFDQVAAFQVSTSRILAEEARPENRREWPLAGVENLTPGFNLKVWVLDERWANRFASRVHTFSLELENTGLKPFSELEVALVWRDRQGTVWKTLVFRPVSAFRSALPSGARLGWTQESVFDSEVFSWVSGNEPYPTLELRRWQ